MNENCIIARVFVPRIVYLTGRLIVGAELLMTASNELFVLDPVCRRKGRCKKHEVF
jgi:hypothetical protein